MVEAIQKHDRRLYCKEGGDGMSKYSTFQLLNKELLSKYSESNDYKAISHTWEKCFKTILSKDYGFNKEARKVMYEWGEYGFNWEALHNEEGVNKDEYMRRFMSEVNYCSDRMSLDRLLRCHHQYRCMMYCIRYEEEVV